MVRVIRCHRRNIKINIINGSEVSRLSVAIHLFRCLEDSDKHLDELWRMVPWPLHQPDWKQSEECSQLALCSNHVPLAQLLANPDSVGRWIEEMSHR